MLNGILFENLLFGEFLIIRKILLELGKISQDDEICKSLSANLPRLEEFKVIEKKDGFYHSTKVTKLYDVLVEHYNRTLRKAFSSYSDYELESFKLYDSPEYKKMEFEWRGKAINIEEKWTNVLGMSIDNMKRMVHPESHSMRYFDFVNSVMDNATKEKEIREAIILERTNFIKKYRNHKRNKKIAIVVFAVSYWLLIYWLSYNQITFSLHWR